MGVIRQREIIYKCIIAVLVFVIIIICSKFYSPIEQVDSEIPIIENNTNLSFMQEPDYILGMYAGILEKNFNFEPGEDLEITYDFSHSDYITLREKYNI